MSEIVHLADAIDKMQFDGATPEQVDIIVELCAVARTLQKHCHRVLLGDSGNWDRIAAMMDQAAAACRNEHVIVVERRLLEARRR